jgi:MFS family permease
VSDSTGPATSSGSTADTSMTSDAPENKATPPKPAKAKKPATPEQLERRKAIVRFAIFVVVGALATVLLYFLLSALIPRWWSQLVGRQVSGRISQGILLGLIYGFVFSFLPLIVLSQARHRAFGWSAKGVIVLIAAALTAPNLMTLGIAIGTSPAAQAGDRTMDVTAPGFRYASLWGVVLGALAALVVVTVSILWERRTQELKILRARVDQLEKELPSALPAPSEPKDPPKF